MEPPLSASVGASRPKRRPSLRDALAIREAVAHPGHYVEGEALGEMPLPASIDLLAPAELLG